MLTIPNNIQNRFATRNQTSAAATVVVATTLGIHIANEREYYKNNNNNYTTQNESLFLIISHTQYSNNK